MSKDLASLCRTWIELAETEMAQAAGNDPTERAACRCKKPKLVWKRLLALSRRPAFESETAGSSAKGILQQLELMFQTAEAGRDTYTQGHFRVMEAKAKKWADQELEVQEAIARAKAVASGTLQECERQSNQEDEECRQDQRDNEIACRAEWATIAEDFVKIDRAEEEAQQMEAVGPRSP